jgi:Fe-S cluster biosynthesis and repair protein YggX
LLLLEEIYKTIPAVNFSSFVLEKIPQHLFVMEVPDVYWSDWGEEQRILLDNERFAMAEIKSKPYEEVIKRKISKIHRTPGQVRQQIVYSAK